MVQSPDESRTQVALNALGRGREYGGVVLDGELAAVLGVARPAALHTKTLARLGAQQVAHYRHQRLAAAGSRAVRGASGQDAGDCVAGLVIGVGDALKDGLQGRQRMNGDRRRMLLHEDSVSPS